MTATLSVSAPPPSDTRLARFFRDSLQGSPALALHAGLLFVGFLIVLALTQIDDRTIYGANVWHKPAKFFFSIGLQFLTVAWAISLLPTEVRTLRKVTIPSKMMIAAGWGEIVYIVFRAARAEASHFNYETIWAELAYALMGVGAIVLVFTSCWIGLVLWRHRAGSLWREAAGLGLILSTALTTPVAFYLSSHTVGHWVGGELSDANGLRLFLWSTTGGDLRVPHFVALHAMQAVPFAALSGSRGVVNGVALAFVVATVALFLQALLGIPLFRL
jgi:hypothetical protein